MPRQCARRIVGTRSCPCTSTRTRPAADGGALYDALLKLVRKQGILSAYGLVTVPNEASERLHEAFGFERSWIQPHAGWKNGTWHDVAWYVKPLAPFPDNPSDPMPFDECVRLHGGFVQQVLAEANAAVAAGRLA